MSKTSVSADVDGGGSSSLGVFLTLAVVIFAAVAPLILLTAPVVAGQLGSQLHLKPENIGLFFTVELGAMSFATIPSYLWLPRVSQRLMSFIAIIVFVVSNLIAATLPSFDILLLLQFTAGLAGGTLMILCLTTAGRALNQDRVFGFWVIGQLILGAICLWIFPVLFKMFHLPALFISLAVLLIIVTPLAFAFPSVPLRAKKHLAQTQSASMVKPIIGLVGILAFYLSIGGVWTFMSALGAKSGLEAEVIGRVLSIATLFGIAGAAVASAIGNRGKRELFLIIGYGLLILSIILMLNMPAFDRYFLSACIFKFAWTFVLPFILAAIGSVDPSGRAIATVNLIIGGGLAVGPIIAGWLLQQSGSFHLPLIAEIIAGIISFLLLLFTALPTLRGARKLA